MGSYKSYPTSREKKLISRMINSAFYLLNFVFILKENNHYRLVAIHEENKIIDLDYKTFKGAKIACSRMLRNHTGNTEMRPVWSFLYPPDEDWLADKLNRPRNTIPLPIIMEPQHQLLHHSLNTI